MAREYASKAGLTARRSLYESLDGPDVKDELLHAVLARPPGRVLEVGDIQALPFGAGEFDCVIAAWMLYHVPDLDRELSEVARVLRPGGRLIAATNSDRRLDELWTLVGAEHRELPFSAENGAGALRRHFAAVETSRIQAWVTLADSAMARDYIGRSPSRSDLATQVPQLPAPLRAGARTYIFVATKG